MSDEPTNDNHDLHPDLDAELFWRLRRAARKMAVDGKDMTKMLEGLRRIHDRTAAPANDDSTDKADN